MTCLETQNRFAEETLLFKLVSDFFKNQTISDLQRDCSFEAESSLLESAFTEAETKDGAEAPSVWIVVV